ncbi:MAG: permease [Chloroflexia bacterium]
MPIVATIVRLLQGGLGNLAAYLAAHVLLCLVPAFFIAGGLAALIPREAITRFLGKDAPKYISYPAAALAGSVLAVCSCTIVPLFAGIRKKGAGLGPAITFLFFAPASNVLALAYTGVIIGLDLAVARLLLSLAFGVGIGMIMALIFWRSEQLEADENNGFRGQGAKVPRVRIVFLLLLVTLLLSGTFKIGLLTNRYLVFELPIAGMDRFQESLNRLVPYDPSKGEEGVSVQGAILIGLLVLIGLAAWRGLNQVYLGRNRWTGVTMGLVVFTLLFAALGIGVQPGGVQIALTGRFFGVVLFTSALAVVGLRFLSGEEIEEWLWESWRFVKQIFPLLLVGVFVVGVIRGLIRPEWIEYLAGKNTLFGNLAGVVFGVFMYFPTLVEVPIANMFLSLGMHRGPLLAYLMADPELSLQSILVVSKIIGRLKAWVYVGWVALFSTLAGLLYGAWVDGTPIWRIALYLVAFLGVLSLGLWRIGQRKRRLLAEAR